MRVNDHNDELNDTSSKKEAKMHIFTCELNKLVNQDEDRSDKQDKLNKHGDSCPEKREQCCVWESIWFIDEKYLVAGGRGVEENANWLTYQDANDSDD